MLTNDQKIAYFQAMAKELQSISRDMYNLSDQNKGRKSTLESRLAMKNLCDRWNNLKDRFILEMDDNVASYAILKEIV